MSLGLWDMPKIVAVGSVGTVSPIRVKYTVIRERIFSFLILVAGYSRRPNDLTNFDVDGSVNADFAKECLIRSYENKKKMVGVKFPRKTEKNLIAPA
jgi:hypothetical protein